MAPAWYGPLALLVALFSVEGRRSVSSASPSTPRPTPPARLSARIAVSVPTILVVHVVDSASRQPLPNAEVMGSLTRRLTDAQGNARFSWPADGTLKIRVRQIGFRYVQRTLHRGDSPTAREDTIVVALQHAAFALPQMVTEAPARCIVSQDSAALALSNSSMELLRFGAEQYNSFRMTYPFSVSLARRTVRSPVLGGPRVLETKEVAESETYGDLYHPGQALLRTRTGYYVPVLFVSTLADSVFWDRHCFAARGVETRDNRRVIRLDFALARGMGGVDWEGSAWIDSAASVLRRVDFHLVNVRDPQAPRRFEGYTTFTVPSPFIAVPDSTIAWWWTETEPTPSDDEFTADVLQFLTMRELAYRREMPPAPR